jgi:hypothetical protein
MGELGEELFHGSGMAQYWSVTAQVVDPRTIALWYAASALPGAAAAAQSTLGSGLWYSPAVWHAASDLVQGLTPGPAPPSLAAAAGELAAEYWDEISSWW